MIHKRGGQIAVGILSACYFCFFAFFFLQLLCGLLWRHNFGAVWGLAFLWLAAPLFGLVLSFRLTQKAEYSALSAPEGLPAYANADTYADSTVPFYPEPKGYTEPPRTAPKAPDSKAAYAALSLILGIVGCATPFAGILPGCVAIFLALICRTGTKSSAKKEWNADCRRRAVSGFILGICACIGQILLILFCAGI